MMQARLFPADTVPEYTRADWYADRDSAPHIDEPMHQERLALTRAFLLNTLPHLGEAPTLIDLGCGDGGFLQSIAGLPITGWGYDLQPSNVRVGVEQRGVDVRYGDFLDSANLDADVIIATEVLEHLLDPHGLVRHLHTTIAGTVIASSPWTETPDAHYGFHTWCFDVPGYAALFTDAGWSVVEHATTGMFQVLRATR